jgi:hypothetical protein
VSEITVGALNAGGAHDNLPPADTGTTGTTGEAVPDGEPLTEGVVVRLGDAVGLADLLRLGDAVPFGLEDALEDAVAVGLDVVGAGSLEGASTPSAGRANDLDTMDGPWTAGRRRSSVGPAAWGPAVAPTGPRVGCEGTAARGGSAPARVTGPLEDPTPADTDGHASPRTGDARGDRSVNCSRLVQGWDGAKQDCVCSSNAETEARVMPG